MEPRDLAEITPPNLSTLSAASSTVQHVTLGCCTCIYYSHTSNRDRKSSPHTSEVSIRHDLVWRHKRCCLQRSSLKRIRCYVLIVLAHTKAEAWVKWIRALTSGLSFWFGLCGFALYSATLSQMAQLPFLLPTWMCSEKFTTPTAAFTVAQDSPPGSVIHLRVTQFWFKSRHNKERRKSI